MRKFSMTVTPDDDSVVPEIRLACGHPVILPSKSFLGTFRHRRHFSGKPNFGGSSTGVWPAAFLCTACGRVFSIEEREVKPLPQPSGDTVPALWEIQLRCNQNHCGKAFNTYGNFLAELNEADVEKL